MKPDANELKFWGQVAGIAEDHFGASFHDDHDDKLMRQIYLEFTEAKPKNAKVWIEEKLGNLFMSLAQGPQWVEEGATWPFLDGRPMVFIKQFNLDNSGISADHLSPGATLYLFGGRLQQKEGWEMRYQVVEQHGDSPFAKRDE